MLHPYDSFHGLDIKFKIPFFGSPILKSRSQIFVSWKIEPTKVLLL